MLGWWAVFTIKKMEKNLKTISHHCLFKALIPPPTLNHEGFSLAMSLLRPVGAFSWGSQLASLTTPFPLLLLKGPQTQVTNHKAGEA